MRFARKKQGKFIHAWKIGENSAIEKALIEKKKILLNADGSYSLFSLEALHGQGEIAQKGDYFKVNVVNGEFFCYPIRADWFQKNHRHIFNDEYEQISKPLPFFLYEDFANKRLPEEIEFLLNTGKLFIKKDDAAHYFTAFVFGTKISAPQDSAIILYEVTRTSDKKIFTIDFNIVQRNIFNRDYEILP